MFAITLNLERYKNIKSKFLSTSQNYFKILTCKMYFQLLKGTAAES